MFADGKMVDMFADSKMVDTVADSRSFVLNRDRKSGAGPEKFSAFAFPGRGQSEQRSVWDRSDFLVQFHRVFPCPSPNAYFISCFAVSVSAQMINMMIECADDKYNK